MPSLAPLGCNLWTPWVSACPLPSSARRPRCFTVEQGGINAHQCFLTPLSSPLQQICCMLPMVSEAQESEAQEDGRGGGEVNGCSGARVVAGILDLQVSGSPLAAVGVSCQI